MKAVLSALTIFASLNVFAESEQTIRTQRKCYNSYEASIKNFILHETQTKKCAVQDAKLFGEIECEKLNGQINHQHVSVLNCETKIYDHMNKRYNRTTCIAIAETSCIVK